MIHGRCHAEIVTDAALAWLVGSDAFGAGE
jgi:hypothetical protein